MGAYKELQRLTHLEHLKLFYFENISYTDVNERYVLFCNCIYVLFTLFVFVCVYWCPAHIVSCFVLFFFVLCDLCCQFLWIVHSVSCVLYVASFSGLFIQYLVFSMLPVSLDCSFSILCSLCCQFLWIVHCLLPLRYYLTFIYRISRSYRGKNPRTIIVPVPFLTPVMQCASQIVFRGKIWPQFTPGCL